MNCDKLLNNYFNSVHTTGLLSQSQMFGVLTSSALSVVGLIYNDYSVLLGAMLTSPMGSPARYQGLSVIGGETSHIWTVLRMITVMAVIAFGFGFISVFINEHIHFAELPTPNMEKLSNMLFMKTNFIIGCISGLATPFAIKFNQTIAMTGLRLAVSVLPATVNSGMYVGLSLLHEDKRKEYQLRAWRSFQITLANLMGMWLSSMVGFYLICQK